MFSDIPQKSEKSITTLYHYPQSKEDYITLTFFKNWVLGFTNAEGSFLVKNNHDLFNYVNLITHYCLNLLIFYLVAIEKLAWTQENIVYIVSVLNLTYKKLLIFSLVWN